MAFFKKKYEIDAMCDAGRRLQKVFSEIVFSDLIGKSTLEIDCYIANLLEKYLLVSCVKGYKGFPRYSCISINDELVHGVPKKTVIIKEKDFVKVDICASYNGFCADACRWYGNILAHDVCKRMVVCADNALASAIKMCKKGNTIGEIACTIEDVIIANGYSVVVDFAGHGIGKKMHEDPMVPNFFDKEDHATMQQKIYPGMAFAIEPMFCQWKADLLVNQEDGWTVKTVDGGLAMHIEDTVIVGEHGAIVTTRLI